MRLIDADGIHYTRLLSRQGLDMELVAKVAIDDMPTVDAEPVRHGRWILSGPDLHGNIRPKCSVCGKYRLAQWADHIKCNYCPECGAKMDGDTT